MSKLNFKELLDSKTEFIVPTIQRDYAQGRNNGADKDLCEEVRTDFVKNLFNVLKKDEELVLDYVYGSDIGTIFYPIDGQQRLTTLFLLYWYIGKKEHVSLNDMSFLKKFTYQIRDTSIEFCKSLLDIELDVSDKDKDCVSAQIKNSSKYHNAFGFDPTIGSMLVVLDKIDAEFRNEPTNFWQRLDKIKFWSLSLQQFGLTDDLFVKMNARGKRLARFDVFKSDLESCLSKITASHTVDIWKKEIDNSFLDQYWIKFGASNSERNLFRTILFYIKSIMLIQDENTTYDESWELDTSKVKYADVVKHISDNIVSLEELCELLKKFDIWFNYIPQDSLFASGNQEKNIKFYEKASIFGVLYWFSKSNHNSIDDTFKQFYRIMLNYIYSLRQPDYKPRRRYSSSIDNKAIAKVLIFIKTQLVDSFNDSKTYEDYIFGTSCSELKFEREKINAVKAGTISINDIVELENITYLRRNIHNFFFNDQIPLSAGQIKTIFDDRDLTNKALRIIFSFAPNRYGLFQELLFDPIKIQSGKKSLYYNDSDDQATGYLHKYAFGNIDDDFGDRVLTAKGSEQYDAMSLSVRKFVTAIKCKLDQGVTIPNAIDDLLLERINLGNYSDSRNILPYIVKYKEFFYEDTGTTVSTLRRKDYQTFNDIDNIYDIQCISNDNDFEKDHYHPFYMALCHLLNARITLNETSLKYPGVQIEYAHPCTLSNGWVININEKGNWIIKFSGTPPISTNPSFTVVSPTCGYFDCSGKDSIKEMADFLNSI